MCQKQISEGSPVLSSFLASTELAFRRKDKGGEIKEDTDHVTITRSLQAFLYF